MKGGLSKEMRRKYDKVIGDWLQEGRIVRWAEEEWEQWEQQDKRVLGLCVEKEAGRQAVEAWRAYREWKDLWGVGTSAGIVGMASRVIAALAKRKAKWRRAKKAGSNRGGTRNGALRWESILQWKGGVQERAMCVVGVFFLLRGTAVRDIQEHELWVFRKEERAVQVILDLDLSKTKQGKKIILVGEEALIVAAALEEWLAVRVEEEMGLAENGQRYLFSEGGNKWTSRRFTALMAKVAGECGLEGALYGAHSLRKGGAHSMLVLGATLAEVMVRGVWKSMETLLSYLQGFDKDAVVSGRTRRELLVLAGLRAASPARSIPRRRVLLGKSRGEGEAVWRSSIATEGASGHGPSTGL
jgi:hypothetical protein